MINNLDVFEETDKLVFELSFKGYGDGRFLCLRGLMNSKDTLERTKFCIHGSESYLYDVARALHIHSGAIMEQIRPKTILPTCVIQRDGIEFEVEYDPEVPAEPATGLHRTPPTIMGVKVLNQESLLADLEEALEEDEEEAKVSMREAYFDRQEGVL